MDNVGCKTANAKRKRGPAIGKGNDEKFRGGCDGTDVATAASTVADATTLVASSTAAVNKLEMGQNEKKEQKEKEGVAALWRKHRCPLQYGPRRAYPIPPQPTRRRIIRVGQREGVVTKANKSACYNSYKGAGIAYHQRRVTLRQIWKCPGREGMTLAEIMSKNKIFHSKNRNTSRPSKSRDHY